MQDERFRLTSPKCLARPLRAVRGIAVRGRPVFLVTARTRRGKRFRLPVDRQFGSDVTGLIKGNQ